MPRRIALELLRDSWKGKRCFILATGPSVAKQDISWLRNELVIGINFAHKITGPQGWYPQYMVSADAKISVQAQDEWAKLPSRIVLTETCMMLCKYSARNLASGPGVPLKYAAGRFEYDCAVGICVPLAWSTTGHLALPFACFLGCSEIILLGCDCTASGHAYDDKGVVWPGALEHFHKFFFPAMRTIRILMERKGVRILNATSGGNLEEFERVTLESLKP